MAVRMGVEILRAEGFDRLRGHRIGLMTNPSAVDQNLTSTHALLTQDSTIHIRAIFSPEHGFAGAAPDAEKVASGVDRRTGIPIYSLYGDTYRPSPDMLKDIDRIVCDIQDVGVRFYTYIWTISYILEAAGEHGIEVIILDRPNPLGGLTVDGPSLEPNLASFVGRFPIPIVHGMTVGELAQMINAHWNPTPCTLTVIPCQGWRRTMDWMATGRIWIPPSPAVPHYETLCQYPGACLIEGTNLSEGRGTALPFQITGAPWINGSHLADQLNAEAWAGHYGVRFRPHTFLPTDSKWRGEYCQGIQVHITEPANWNPLRVWLGIILTIRRLYPDQFAWLLPSHVGVEPGQDYHFDRLMGSEDTRHKIDAGAQLAELTQGWEENCQTFAALRRAFLLY